MFLLFCFKKSLKKKSNNSIAKKKYILQENNPLNKRVHVRLLHFNDKQLNKIW